MQTTYTRKSAKLPVRGPAANLFTKRAQEYYTRLREDYAQVKRYKTLTDQPGGRELYAFLASTLLESARGAEQFLSDHPTAFASDSFLTLQLLIENIKDLTQP